MNDDVDAFARYDSTAEPKILFNLNQDKIAGNYEIPIKLVDALQNANQYSLKVEVNGDGTVIVDEEELSEEEKEELRKEEINQNTDELAQELADMIRERVNKNFELSI